MKSTPVRRSMYPSKETLIPSSSDPLMFASWKLCRSDVAQISEPHLLLICVLNDLLQSHYRLRHGSSLEFAAGNISKPKMACQANNVPISGDLPSNSLMVSTFVEQAFFTASPLSARPCERKLVRITQDGNTCCRRWREMCFSSINLVVCLSVWFLVSIQRLVISRSRATSRSIQRIVYPARSVETCVLNAHPIQ